MVQIDIEQASRHFLVTDTGYGAAAVLRRKRKWPLASPWRTMTSLQDLCKKACSKCSLSQAGSDPSSLCFLFVFGRHPCLIAANRTPCRRNQRQDCRAIRTTTVARVCSIPHTYETHQRPGQQGVVVLCVLFAWLLLFLVCGCCFS